jgi:multiple sugar transport system ATP-binding protein
MSDRLPQAGYVGLRPESLSLAPAGRGQLGAKVDLVEALGAETLIYVSTERGTSIAVRQTARSTLRPGDAVGVEIDSTAVHVFDADGRVVAQPN